MRRLACVFFRLFPGFQRSRGVASGVRGVLSALQLQRPGHPASRAQPTQSENKPFRVLGGTYRGGGVLAFRTLTRLTAVLKFERSHIGRNRVVRTILYGTRGALWDGMELDGMIR